MFTDQEKALLVGLLIGSMLEEFPNTKNINKMKERIRKFTARFSKQNKQRYAEIAKIGDDIWQKTITAMKGETIEPRFFVQNLFTVYEDFIAKHLHINEKMIEKAMTNIFLPFEYEKSCNKVADYIVGEMAVYTDVYPKNGVL